MPQFSFTALHDAAMGENVLVEAKEHDSRSLPRLLVYSLKKKFNAQCEGDMITALHIAVQISKLIAVQLLFDLDEIQVSVENIYR